MRATQHPRVDQQPVGAGPQLVYDITVLAGTTHTPPISGTIDLLIDWGDGQSESATASVSHTYTNAGTYRIVLEGSVTSFAFNNGGDRLHVTDVIKVEDVGLTNVVGMWYGCTNGVTDLGDYSPANPDWAGIINQANVTSMWRGYGSVSFSSFEQNAVTATNQFQCLRRHQRR